MLSGNEAANPTCRLHPPLRRSQPATHSHQAHHDRCLRFPLQVTEDDLEQFHASFKGGEEERAELLKYYRQFEGDMAKVRGGTGWHLRRWAVGRMCLCRRCTNRAGRACCSGRFVLLAVPPC